MRFSFVSKEVGNGLRRNFTMTVALIVSVAVSLSLVGAALLMSAQVDRMKGYWYDKIEVSIFLCGELSDSPTCSGGPVTVEQRAQIESDLKTLPIVANVYYESQAEAFARFKERFKGTALVDNVTADQLPESYRVKLKDPKQFAIVQSAFSGRP